MEQNTAEYIPPTAPPPLLPSKDERMWGMLCHLTALAGCLGIPLANILGPLIVWLIKREEFPLVADQGKEALNFQITAMLAAIICIPLIFVGVGVLLLVIIGIGTLILTIIAGVKANEGVRYRYPMTIRFIK